MVQGDFEQEVRQVLENIKAVLIAGGSDLDRVVKVSIFLKEMSQFGTLNAIYSEYFNESRPARACVEVSELPKGVQVEMEAIALCDQL